MKFHVIYISSVSACFELDNSLPFFAQEEFDVCLNGSVLLKNVNTNVFSIFDLEPDTEYKVSVGEYSLCVRTKEETTYMDIRAFGAVGDGISDDTDAIRLAVERCPVGGRLIFQKGIYRTQPITLKSDITIELKRGAVILGEPREDKYPVIPEISIDQITGESYVSASWEGEPYPCHASLINAYGERNITVVGEGSIDGNAHNSTWWQRPKGREVARPRLVFFNRCEGIIFHGVTGKNSASWNFHPFFCKNVRFFDTAVEAPSNSPNTDGLNPESCYDVEIIGMRFSVGDDAIAIKSGKMYMGMKYKTPAQKHTIRNCFMGDAHGAVVLGSEMSGGVKDLNVSQCYFKNTERGLRIKTRRGRGKHAVIDGVGFSNIRMDNVKAPFVMNMYYFCDPDGHDEIVWSKKARPIDDTTPYLGAFEFTDMECSGCEWAAGYFYGLPERPIASVKLSNVSFSFKDDAAPGIPAMMDGVEPLCKSGLYFNRVGVVGLNNVSVNGCVGDRLITENVGQLIDE